MESNRIPAQSAVIFLVVSFGDQWGKHRQPLQQNPNDNYSEMSDLLKAKNQIMGGNASKQYQDSPNQKKRTNGVHSQPESLDKIKTNKKFHLRELQDNFETHAYDLPTSCEDQLLEHAEGQSVACNGHCKFPFLSRACLSFRCDQNAIMKINLGPLIVADVWWKSQDQKLVAFEWVSLSEPCPSQVF